jgi:hypothetical protein
VIRQRVSGFLGQSLAPPSEQVCELAEGGEQVDNTKSRDGAADEIIREHDAERGHRVDKVVPVPERRPGNQDQQQPGFEQEGDEKQTSEQGNYPLACAFDRRSIRLATSR